MLELVFDQSLAGAMRQAKGHCRGVAVSQGVKFYIADDAEGESPESWSESCEIRTDWNGEVLEGTAADVALLSLGLHVGDLSGMDQPGLAARREALRRLEEPWGESAWETYWEENLETLARLEQAVETGKQIRIWATPWCPHEVCGLYHACQLLRNKNTPVFWVHPPEKMIRKDSAVELVHGLGQFPPETLGDLAAGATVLPADLLRFYANRWLELVNENASLRAVVNGKLMSVPEDFYDFAVRRNLPIYEPKKMGLVIAETLQQMPGIGDTWLYLRLMRMVEQGEAEIVEPARPDHPYSAMIRKLEP